MARSWELLVQACRRIAPKSKVLCCNVFYRSDVGDGLVDAGNEMMKGPVEDMDDGVVWVAARRKMGQDMLVDHVHLNEEVYGVWDEVLWAHVVAALGLEE
jgi:hypothetical protein